MKNKLVQILILFIVIIISIKLNGQRVIPVVSKIENTCTGNQGSIQIELKGDTTLARYFWENGERTLIRKNLAPGIYTFTVYDETDCLPIIINPEVKLLNAPTAIYSKIDLSNCASKLIAKVYNSSTQLQNEGFDIQWSDGVSNEWERIVPNSNTTADMCIEIKDKGKCNFAYAGCKTLPLNTCGDTRAYYPLIIVNEFNRNQQNGKYIELVVLGDKNCKNTTDLRNYSIVALDKPLHVGNNSSYIGKRVIRFNDSENWSRIPNGSVIVIYDENIKNNYIDNDDPYDQDNDKVYISKGSNKSLFNSRIIQAISKDSIIFSNIVVSSKWGDISISSSHKQYGYAVFDNNGIVIHGIGISDSVQNVYNSIPFTNFLIDTQNYIISLQSDIYSNRIEYTKDSLFTPGFGNSLSNNNLISQIRNCNYTYPLPSNINNIVDESKADQLNVGVFPNPNSGEFLVKFENSRQQRIGFEIFDVLGKNFYKQSSILAQGNTEVIINLGIKVPPGVYYVGVKNENGKIYVSPFVIIK